jgi:uncharacterized protein (DUF952 family)
MAGRLKGRERVGPVARKLRESLALLAGIPRVRLNLRDGADIAELEGAQVTTIYKICGQAAWREAEAVGAFRGSVADARDGYIHFSTAAQIAETAARHFANEPDLVLVAVDADALGRSLKWEPSRGGALFPHLYAPLPLSAVRWARSLPRAADGRHLLPELEP